MFGLNMATAFVTAETSYLSDIYGLDQGSRHNFEKLRVQFKKLFPNLALKIVAFKVEQSWLENVITG